MANIDDIKILLKDFFINKPIDRAWIFGSYARGEQTPNSDIDILVDFDKKNNLSLFGLAAIINELETLTNSKVDLVDRKNLYPYVAKFVEKEKILIYERN